MTATDPAGAAVDSSAEPPALEAERDFLIRSLKDLDAERDAGDIDEADYDTLKDDYTARAAAVLRAIEASRAPRSSQALPPLVGQTRAAGSGRAAVAAGSGRAAVAAGSADRVLKRRRNRRTAVVTTIVVVFAGIAAWTMSQSTGARVAGQSVSGDNRALSTSTTSKTGAAAGSTSVDSRLVSAANLVNQGKVAEALQLYDEILKDNPNQPIALANDGWLLAQAGLAGAGPNLVDAGLAKITQAEKIDKTYTAVHFFRGFLLLRAKNDPAGAVTEFRSYLGAVDPSSPEVPQVEQLLSDAIKAAGPSVPVGPNAPTTPTPTASTAPTQR